MNELYTEKGDNMRISLFDTHADTPYELHKRNEKLTNNSLHISLDKTNNYKEFCQCMAVWSDKCLSDDEAFWQFSQVYDYFKTVIKQCNTAQLCRNYKEIEQALSSEKSAFILTVEDARILNGEIQRLDVLDKAGVKILTFQWQGETCIGGGFDTDKGLTPFGFEVAHECAKRNIIPDISHANEKTARQIIEISAEHGKSVIATHSNSYSVCRHKRNMTNELYDTLVSVGGIVGISLAPQHLSVDHHASSEDVFRHIDHYAQRNGIEHICLGCDFDGIETTPTDIKNISELEALYECMQRHGYTESEINCVFSKNARSFLSKNLI